MARKKTSQEETTGGDLNITAPNDKYQKFFDKFAELDHLPVEDWKVAHLIGYFTRQFQQAYQSPYKFKFNSPTPTKCFEVFQLKKLSLCLTNQPNLLKDYMDWVFLEKVKKEKRRFTSISFLTNENFMNEFKHKVLLLNSKTNNIDRTTNLPPPYKAIFNNININISTYGELAFLAQMSSPNPVIQQAFEQLSSLGFDRSILSRIV